MPLFGCRALGAGKQTLPLKRFLSAGYIFALERVGNNRLFLLINVFDKGLLLARGAIFPP